MDVPRSQNSLFRLWNQASSRQWEPFIIVNDDGIEFDVVVTVEELTSFRDTAAQAAETGQQLEFDDWTFHVLQETYATFQTRER